MDDVELEKYGLLTNTSTAIRWLPVLPLLKALEDSKSIEDKSLAIKHLVAFLIKTGLNAEPDKNKFYKLYGKIADLIRTDQEFRNIIEELIQ